MCVNSKCSKCTHEDQLANLCQEAVGMVVFCCSRKWITSITAIATTVVGPSNPVHGKVVQNRVRFHTICENDCLIRVDRLEGDFEMNII